MQYKVIISERAKEMLGMHIRLLALNVNIFY